MNTSLCVLLALACVSAPAYGQCPVFCPLNWNPVCGYDGINNCFRVFDNECILLAYNCSHTTQFIQEDAALCNQALNNENGLVSCPYDW